MHPVTEGWERACGQLATLQVGVRRLAAPADGRFRRRKVTVSLLSYSASRMFACGAYTTPSGQLAGSYNQLLTVSTGGGIVLWELAVRPTMSYTKLQTLALPSILGDDLVSHFDIQNGVLTIISRQSGGIEVYQCRRAIVPTALFSLSASQYSHSVEKIFSSRVLINGTITDFGAVVERANSGLKIRLVIADAAGDASICEFSVADSHKSAAPAPSLELNQAPTAPAKPDQNGCSRGRSSADEDEDGGRDPVRKQRR